jgi:Predicted glutamine amidotransferases
MLATSTEIALILEAQRRRTPVLAICRGIQVLNVAFGGTLVQDIPAECPGAFDHDAGGPRNAPTHEISIEPSTRTSDALGRTSATVNSLHHQSVRDVADQLRITARSPDGIIEGVETKDPDWWVLAVQWHPEDMTESPDSPDRGLFSSFAEQLGKRRSR